MTENENLQGYKWRKRPDVNKAVSDIFKSIGLVAFVTGYGLFVSGQMGNFEAEFGGVSVHLMAMALALGFAVMCFVISVYFSIQADRIVFAQEKKQEREDASDEGEDASDEGETS